MKLYIYKYLPDTLNDHEKVFAFLMTMMFRNVESEGMTLTIHRKDMQQILYAGLRGELVMVEKLNHESPLSEFFRFADFGDRIAVKIKDKWFATTYGGKRRIGTHRIEIKEESACRVAVYLHAVLNHMEHWFTSDDFNIFTAKELNKTRWAPDGHDFYQNHELFRAENVFRS